MTELTPLFMDISSVYSGDELGLPHRDLINEGIVGAGSLAVSQRAQGANLSVDVASGACWILGDTNPQAQPCYRCRNDAAVNLGITPDAAQPRKVLVVAQITDETFSGIGRKWQLVAIHGTPAVSPVEPDLPASALPLALVDVTAGDTSIENAQITDRRVAVSSPLVSSPMGLWQAYTPAWSALTTQPVLNNGTIVGRYVQIGKTVMGYVILTMGSSTTYGSGAYYLSLPVAAHASEIGQVIGHARGVDASPANGYGAHAYAVDANKVAFDTQASPIAGWTNAVPITWASGDSIRLQFAYEAA